LVEQGIPAEEIDGGFEWNGSPDHGFGLHAQYEHVQQVVDPAEVLGAIYTKSFSYFGARLAYWAGRTGS
jgi:hypothetical protein